MLVFNTVLHLPCGREFDSAGYRSPNFGGADDPALSIRVDDHVENTVLFNASDVAKPLGALQIHVRRANVRRRVVAGRVSGAGLGRRIAAVASISRVRIGRTSPALNTVLAVLGPSEQIFAPTQHEHIGDHKDRQKPRHLHDSLANPVVGIIQSP